MGRPRGSKNRAREFDISAQPYVAPQLPETTIINFEGPPAFVTITLTDEDLAPARQAKANHAKAAAKHIQAEIMAEARRRDGGEIEELSVPQVIGFDMSAAFTKIAQQKARAAGYRFAHALRKTPEGWVFDASNSPKVQNVPAQDQL